MNVIAVNGSPRKKNNTATLLEKALEGAASQGATTELIHLYDLDFKGCISCFACKTRGGASYGRCAVADDLTPVFRKIEEAGVLVLGSPIYFGAVTGEMKSFLERLLYPYSTYTNPPQTLFPNRIRSGFIYTMNTPESALEDRGYVKYAGYYEAALKKNYGASEFLFSCDTWQFEDYAAVVADRFDPVKKAARHKEVFPQDCEKAFALGARLAANGV